MLMTSLRLATVTAVFAAWIATLASAQSADEGYYSNLSTHFRGAGMKFA